MTVNTEETNEDTESVEQDSVSTEEVTETTEDADEALEAGEITKAEWDKFTYSVRDEEKEFDEKVRPFIKDEESYKLFQDLYTARDGLPLAKQERDDYRDKFTNLNESLSTVNKFVQAGDAANFIKALGLPEKMFIDYAINKLKYKELPPEERARIDSENQGRLRMHQLEIQNETLQQQYSRQAQQQRLFELDNGLNNPDVAPLIKDYDARVGKPGAFKQAAIERGIFHSQVNGVDMGALDVIHDTINYFGLRAVGTPNQQHVQAGAQGHTQVAPGQKPVIPNLQGRGTSPVGRRSPTSIEDIKAIRAERLAAQGG